MKLTDENGEEWEWVKPEYELPHAFSNQILIRKIEKPANPMPVPVNGQTVVREHYGKYIVIKTERRSNGSHWIFTLSELNGAFWFPLIEVTKIFNYDLETIWSREGK